MLRLLENIGRHIELDEREEAFVLSLLKKKRLKRKDFLQRQGELCRSIYFVNKGSLRCYYEGPDQKESTIMFAFADWWITDMRCFIHQLPADTHIQALEESEVGEISKASFDQLFEEIPKFERLFRILMQNAYIREQTRMLEHLTCSAEARYQKYISKYPRIEQLVSQKHIASYLGITPEFLSFTKKKAQQKNS
ncbi:MAG: Crp/Fnr family transcriptional regulator [Bacteroidia bacterium]|nr:Crp/Fnr family transcriptional regulator [Bacteroidia bacterium]